MLLRCSRQAPAPSCLFAAPHLFHNRDAVGQANLRSCAHRSIDAWRSGEPAFRDGMVPGGHQQEIIRPDAISRSSGRPTLQILASKAAPSSMVTLDRSAWATCGAARRQRRAVGEATGGEST
jgi:hypothetical protein